jgi:hypothetical protein
MDETERVLQVTVCLFEMTQGHIQQQRRAKDIRGDEFERTVD